MRVVGSGGASVPKHEFERNGAQAFVVASRTDTPSPLPRKLAVAIGLACGLCWSAAARAEFKGTPGKVASIGLPEAHCPLRIWEPETGREDIVDPQTWSPPSKSPLGIRP